MNIESQIILDRFQPRPYQREIFDAIDQGYRKLVIVLPRRAGKDLTAWNIAIRQCIKKVCLVQYLLPTFGQARRCIFEAIDIDGNKFLDYIPPRLISKINSSEQKIVFTNGSVLQCLGGDTHDTSIRGTNPFMVVLSEFAYMNSDVYNTVRPILAANGGTILFLSTPYGKNHFYHLFKLAQDLPDWYVIHRKTSDIHHIPEEALEQERQQMSAELFEQEYQSSFDRGVDGSIYGRYIQKAKEEGRVTHVPWEPDMLVHVAIDIGVRDATTMIWFQTDSTCNVIRIIDCYSNTGLGLDHYAAILQNRNTGYRYGKYFAPHDLQVREWGGGAITRYEKARQLDINFTILEQIDVMDGIENVWSNFGKMWFDATKCRSLINALENYRKEWDDVKQVYTKIIHDANSHYADSMRYLCQSLHKTKKGLSGEEFDRARAQAIYGPGNFRQKIFNHDPRFDR
jgi:phage terminase large subunit